MGKRAARIKLAGNVFDIRHQPAWPGGEGRVKGAIGVEAHEVVDGHTIGLGKRSAHHHPAIIEAGGGRNKSAVFDVDIEVADGGTAGGIELEQRATAHAAVIIAPLNINSISGGQHSAVEAISPFNDLAVESRDRQAAVGIIFGRKQLKCITIKTRGGRIETARRVER